MRAQDETRRTFLHGMACRVCFVFSKVGKNLTHCNILTNTVIWSQMCCLFSKKSACGEPEVPKWAWGDQSYKNDIHIDLYVVCINSYLLLCPIGIRGINYLAFAIIRSWVLVSISRGHSICHNLLIWLPAACPLHTMALTAMEIVETMDLLGKQAGQ